MNPAIWICLVFMFLLVFWQQRQQRFAAIRHILVKKKMKGRKTAMSDMIDRFIGKECMIYTMNSNIAGTIIAAGDGWISVDNGQETESVNLDYIVRIREYPRKKNGKKKSIIVD